MSLAGSVGRISKAKAPSKAEERLWFDIKASKLPIPIREFRFHPVRRWRFDFAYPTVKVAMECEGGIWTFGRHNRGTGFTDDCEKYNNAAVLGWRVLRFPPSMVNDGTAIQAITEILQGAA